MTVGGMGFIPERLLMMMMMMMMIIIGLAACIEPAHAYRTHIRVGGTALRGQR